MKNSFSLRRQLFWAFAAALFFCIPAGFAQQTAEPVYEMVDTPPQFIGGNVALTDYYTRNLKYPEDAMKRGIEGQVVVQFVIDKNGRIGGAKVLRGVSPDLDAEALRVVNAMPAWRPGSNKGQRVAVRYTMPIFFQLQNEILPADSIENQADESVKPPLFPGGNVALAKYFYDNMRYPPSARLHEMEGTVYVQFLVDKTGQILNPTVVKRVDPALDAEALRLVREMPAWNPAERNGQKIEIRYSIPVTFRLEDEKFKTQKPEQPKSQNSRKSAR